VALALVAGACSSVATSVDTAGDVPAGPGRYNVILIVTDDQTADTLPADPAPMPWLQDRLADPDDHWVRFSSAFSNISLCCPARATLLTGQYGHHTGVENNLTANKLRDGSTLATWLDGAGYETAMVGKYLNGYPWKKGTAWKPPGWDKWAAVDFSPDDERYYDYRLIVDGAVENHAEAPDDYLTDVLATRAVNFVDSAPATRPFFLYFAPIAGHHPWTPAPRHVDALAAMAPIRRPSFNEQDVSDKPAWIQELPFRDSTSIASVDTYRRQAWETLMAADDAVRDIVAAVARRGALDNTVIAFVSDHGHSYAEHRWFWKRCVYEECNHVPLAIRYPDAANGVRTDLVTNADLAPTLASAAGITPGNPVDGVDLTPALAGGAVASRPGVLLFGPTDALPGYWAVRTPEYLYAELSTGEKELYDLEGATGPADPFELDNRAGTAAYASVESQLAATLASMRPPPPPPPAGTTVTISNAAPSPTPARVAQGATVTWKFSGTRPHSVLDNTGLGLFDSGARAPGETFAYRFAAAGSFAYRCGLHAGEWTGRVNVPVKALPTSGTQTTPFSVTWASDPPTAGYVHDVQIRRPGSTAFVNWQVGVATISRSFTPDAGPGTYTFRARMRRPSTRKSSGYSPAASIRAS
jgi:arylsulfatase A-like enzyme